MRFNPKSSSFRSATLAATLACSSWAHAGLVMVNANTTAQGSPVAPAAAPGINTLDLSGKSGNGAFTLNSGANQVSVSFTGDAAVVSGTVPNVHAAPVTDNNGGTANPYFSTSSTTNANNPASTITLSFASMQSYLGLLWGSIAAGDLLSFYSGSTLVASVTGSQAISAATNYNPANGAQSYAGSQYTLINFLNGVTFNKVVASETIQSAFESANFQYAARNVSAVPEPGSILLLGIGVAGLAANRRRKAITA